MGAGRPQKPQVIKELQGTARADRTNTSAPVYGKITKAPAVPARIKKNTNGAKIWRRLCLQLIQVGMLDEVNVDMIELYVNETIIYNKAMDAVEKDGITMTNDKGNIIPHPARKIASDAMKNMLSIAREFGLTPSTRQKIKTDEPAPKKKTRKKNDPKNVALELGL